MIVSNNFDSGDITSRYGKVLRAWYDDIKWHVMLFYKIYIVLFDIMKVAHLILCFVLELI